MRHLCVVAVTLTLLTPAAAQSLRIDEHASKIALRGTTYDVVLLAAFGQWRLRQLLYEMVARCPQRVHSSM
jgi:hypothetical protein